MFPQFEKYSIYPNQGDSITTSNTIMENLALENKEEKVVKATKKAKEFVSNETIQLIQDILDDGTVDLKWREALKAQVKKYKKDAE
jgi:hypoxanthine-guanine phosphoribosyltransferase